MIGIFIYMPSPYKSRGSIALREKDVLQNLGPLGTLGPTGNLKPAPSKGYSRITQTCVRAFLRYFRDFLRYFRDFLGTTGIDNPSKKLF
jgi:hypothetical protein